MENYGKYISEETTMFVTNKEYYSDNDGFPNDRAFWDFVKNLHDTDRMYLLCLDIDLSPSNAKGTGYGDLIMRTFFVKMQEFFPSFRMRGTKFNIFVPEEHIKAAEEMLRTDNSKYFILHGEIIKDKFVSSLNIEELIAEGIKRMFRGRQDSDMVLGNKGNVPANLQETATKKYISTMWFATITFKETKPALRTLTAYVFPTEYKKPMALLETVVVLDDMVTTKVYDGTVVQLPIDGMRISISVRFDNDGNMVVAWFKMGDSAEGEITGEMELHEGDAIPVSFGKRIGGSKEIYPVKPNSQGLYEYVLFDKTASYPNHKAEYVTTGTVTGKENTYEVHRDSVAIELVKV